MKNESKFPINSMIESLGEIIGEGKKYRIPDYQRPYEWTETNIDEFLNSLITGYSAIPNGKPVFFGTIQFDYRNGKMDIVDGQQRLITFLLYISVIYEICAGHNINRYEEIIEKKDFIDEIVRPVMLDQGEEVSEKNMTRYYQNKGLC